jgi:hypothetical protein
VRPLRTGEATGSRALGIATLFALAACPRHATAERPGPVLSVVLAEGAPTARGAPAESIALALGGLPPEELTRLRQRLEESTDLALRGAAPTLFDLDVVAADAAAPDPFRQVLPDLPPLTAAANLVGAPWNAPGVSVKLGPTCDAAAARCLPLFVPADDRDPVVRRARALAWTLANAVCLRALAASRASLLPSLREAQTRPSSTIALVFAASQGVLDEALLAKVREQARRAATHLPEGAPLRPWLEALAAAQPAWALPIALDPDEVLVIPRLSALARLGDFRAEIDGASRGR